MRFGSERVGVLALGLLAVVAFTLAASPAGAGTIQHGSVNNPFVYDYWHTQLANEDKYDTVGLVDAGATYGSGVLIGSRWVLTAAHVVDTASELTFRFGSGPGEFGGAYKAKRWFVHRDWNGSLFAGKDIALIKLDKPVRDVRPANLWRHGNERDQVGISVGYGATGTGETGWIFSDQQKRAGRNRIDSHHMTNRILLYDFDGDPIRYGEDITDPEDDFPIGMEYMVAPGDSGGPVFIAGKVAGIHSFGWGREDFIADSTFDDTAGSTRVKPFLRWIRNIQRRAMRGLPIWNGAGSEGNPIAGFSLAEKWLEETGFAGEYATALGYWSNVPEPVTFSLVGLGSLALLRRRRRHA